MSTIDEIMAQVFPTGVGMNRLAPAARHGRSGVPYERGDEPDAVILPQAFLSVFPTAWGRTASALFICYRTGS